MLRLLLMGLFLGLLVGSAGAADKPLVEVPLGDSPVRGPANAPVTMIEFIDFQ